MTFGKRVTAAMKHGGFKTDAALAEKLTDLLRSQGRLKRDEEIPEQTVQSARTRVVKGGLSKYTLDIALLCGVRAYWLAFEIGDMDSSDQQPTPSEIDPLWRRLSYTEKKEVIEFAKFKLSTHSEHMSPRLEAAMDADVVAPDHAVSGAAELQRPASTKAANRKAGSHNT